MKRHPLPVWLLFALAIPAATAASQCTPASICGTIDLGRPKLWSLGDAQYLVGQARDKLKALRVALPGEDSGRGVINPNEINLRQLDVLLQSLGVSVQYDQGEALKNRQAQDKFEKDQADYRKNEADRDRLDQLIREKTIVKDSLVAEIAAKETQLNTLDAQIASVQSELDSAKKDLDDLKKSLAGVAPSPAEQREIDRLNTEISNLQKDRSDLRKRRLDLALNLAELKPKKDPVVAEIATLTAQKAALPALTTPTLSVTSTGPPAPAQATANSNVLTEVFKDSAIKDALVASLKRILAEDPKAPYVLVLNNLVDGYLQTIARRLTMLRQSVDPNYDLYFIEVSASIEPSKYAKHHFARARWTIQDGEIDWSAMAAEFVSDSRLEALVRLALRTTASAPARVAGTSPYPALIAATEVVDKFEQEARAPDATLDDQARQKALAPLLAASLAAGCEAIRNETPENRQFKVPDTVRANAMNVCGSVTPAGIEATYRFLIAAGFIAANGGLRDRLALLTGAEPFVFELSPARGVVNIALSQMRENRFSISGILKTLAGFGLGIDYLRQRDNFRQFLQQDVYLAGFGKGGRQFGWDYGPLPGQEIVGSGAYSTYGVLAVPSLRRSIEFTKTSDWLLKPSAGGKPPTEWGADTTAEKIFLPNQFDFWVDSLYYSSVPVGEEISVILRGKGFTQETSVLVNNIPLEPRWRLIDPASGDVSYGDPPADGARARVESGRGTRQTKGEFELVSANTIVMRFQLPDFEGVPQITLVSPHRSIHLNDLPLLVNNRQNRLRYIQRSFESGQDRSHVMFVPKTDWPSIAAPEFLRIDEIGRRADVRLSLRGVYLDGAIVETWNALGWNQLFNLRADTARGVLFLDNVAAVDGDLVLRISRPPAENKVPMQVRLGLPFRPRISSVSKTSGPAAGGTEIEITGVNLAHVDKVYFGSGEATILSRTDHTIRVRSPKAAADAKVVKLRLVSEFTRGGKELASAEEDKEFAYDTAPPAPKPTAIKGITFTALGSEHQPVVAAVEVNVAAGYTSSFHYYTGSQWAVASFSSLGNNRFSLSGLRVNLGKITVRLTATKAGSETITDEKSLDVPFNPFLHPLPPALVAGGDVVTIQGRHLQLAEKVQIGGRITVEPITRTYDQITFAVPEFAALQSATRTVPVVVQAGPRVSTQNVTLTYR